MTNNSNPSAVDKRQVRNKGWAKTIQRGTVVDVLPERHAVRINVRGETNPIVAPVLTVTYGSQTLPRKGSRVIVAYITENVAVVVGSVYTLDTISPPQADDDDLIFGNESGSQVRINSDGSIGIQTDGRKPVNIDHQAASVYLDNDQEVSSNTLTTVQYDTVDEDKEQLFDASEHSFVCRNGGLHKINASFEILEAGQNNIYTIYIYKNGNEIHRRSLQSTTNVPLSPSINKLTRLEKGDKIQIKMENDNGGNRTISGDRNTNAFDIVRTGI